MFPERPLVEIPDEDAIFHTVFDLNDGSRSPAQRIWGRAARTATTAASEPAGKASTTTRVASMIAASYNSDLEDAWEYADDPYCPEKFSGLAIRVGVNYVTYALTH